MTSRTKCVLELCGPALLSLLSYFRGLKDSPVRLSSLHVHVAVLRLPVFNLALGRDEQMSKRLWTDFVFLSTQRYTNGTVTALGQARAGVSPLVGVFCIQLPLQ